MKTFLFGIIVVAVISSLAACTGTTAKVEQAKDQPVVELASPVEIQELVESFNTVDSATSNEKVDLAEIRENFKRINAIKKWSKIEVKEFTGSVEGGETKEYFQDNVLEKIMVHAFGETYQSLTEYYFMDQQLSFVYEQILRYNRPFYYDSTAMKESGDSEAFDFKKSKLNEIRSYFRNGNLVHQITKGRMDGSNASETLADEQARIMDDFLALSGQQKSL